MRHNNILPLLMALVITVPLIMTVSCKTTEKNYRTAYERTIAANDTNRLDFDQTIYGRHRRQMKPRPMVVAGDTLDIRAQQVSLTKECGGIRENIKQYNLVAGEFKQLFNAKSMCERLRQHGYPGAFVVNTNEPYYYVIASSCNHPDQAREALNKLRDAPPFKLRPGLPFILSPNYR